MSETVHKETILAIVTLDKNKVGGQAPIFFAENEQELHRLALYLSQILEAMVHDLANGVMVIVKH